MRAIKREDLENINYYQTPKWLFDLLLEGKITPGAYTTYILMYDRTRVSSKNGWIDKDGDVYIKYSYEEMLIDLKINSKTQIQRNLSKLLELGLIEKKRNFSSSTTYYLNIYGETQNVSHVSTQNVSDSITQNVVVDSTQNVSLISTQIVETSKNNYNKNNFSKNNYKKIDTSADAESLDQEKIKFRENLKKYISKVEEATGKNKEEICRVINPSLMKDYDMNLILKKISESKFLSGKADTKPKINNFCTKSMIDKILVGFYDDREEEKKISSKNTKKAYTAEDYADGWW